MAPSGLPVTQRILDAMVTKFEGIAPGSDYYTRVNKVQLFEPEVLLNTSGRLVALLPIGSDYENPGHKNVGEFQESMEVRVYLVIKTSSDSVARLLEFERDAKKLVVEEGDSGGGKWGGHVYKTEILSATRTIGDDRESASFVELNLRLHFRTPRTDFNTST